MGAFWTVLAIVLLGVCGFLIFLVLSQDAKGGGLAGALGGGAVQTAFGGRSADSVTKLTRWAAIAFFVLVLVMGLTNRNRDIGESDVGESDAPASGGANK